MSGNDQPRVPAGRRDGGRFAAADSDVCVDDLTPERAADRGARRPAGPPKSCSPWASAGTTTCRPS